MAPARAFAIILLALDVARAAAAPAAGSAPSVSTASAQAPLPAPELPRRVRSVGTKIAALQAGAAAFGVSIAGSERPAPAPGETAPALRMRREPPAPETFRGNDASAAIGGALRSLGLAGDSAAVSRLIAGGDGAVAALRARAMRDPVYRRELAQFLGRQTPDSLAKACVRPEDKRLRLELLMLAAPRSTRLAMVDALRRDLADHSDRVKAFIAERPPIRVKRLIIGGGPQGATIANELARLGHAGSTLIVDASAAGGNNFCEVANFRLNSLTGTYDGLQGRPVETKRVLAGGRSQNPLFGSPIQVEDLSPPGPGNLYSSAKDFGIAGELSTYAAFRRGVDILTETRVIDVIDTKKRPGPGRYRVTLEDAHRRFQVLADVVVQATGLGTPAVPFSDEGSRRLAEEEARLLESGSETLAEVRVIQAESLLRAYSAATREQAARFLTHSRGDIVIVGGGDASKTAVELLQRVARENGATVGQLLGRRRIVWLGVDPTAVRVSHRYGGIADLFDAGVAVARGARAEKLRPVEGGRVLVSYRTKEAADSESPDAMLAGRVILAAGMIEHTDMLRHLAPGFRPAANKVPVYGKDEVWGDSDPLATRLQTGGIEHDYYFAGIGSGLGKPKREGAPTPSFLQYFGWKGLLFARQRLAQGVPERSPFDSLRAERTVSK